MALDLEMYRNRLIQERDRLNQDIGIIGEVAETIFEPLSDDRQMTAANAPALGEVVDVQASVVDLKSRRLQQINAALQAIDDGTYGICIKCGKQINPKRLEADPAVLTCIECQSAEDANFQTPDM